MKRANDRKGYPIQSCYQLPPITKIIKVFPNLWDRQFIDQISNLPYEENPSSALQIPG